MNEIIRKYDFDDEHNYYSYNWNHNTTAYTMGTTFIKPLTETDVSITNLTVDSVDTESESNLRARLLPGSFLFPFYPVDKAGIVIYSL